MNPFAVEEVASSVGASLGSTAATMRPWVPQRHRLCASASRISCSLGLGTRFRNAAACMIIPLMQ